MFIKVSNLTKQWSQKAIFSELNLEIEKGKIISLVGPSGCGKTTFLRCMAGLEQISSGTILLNEEDITHTKPENRPIVLMFQQPLLFPHLTILENVTYGLKYQKKRLKSKVRVEKGLEILEKVELLSLANRYPHQLSGGQQQRVALARALIMNPALLLLDEPFSSLDKNLKVSIRNWVREFLKKEGMTAIFVTHDREEAMIIGDEIVVMKEGMFQQIGTPQDVYKNPANRLVAEAFSEGLKLPFGFVAADKLTLSAPLKQKSNGWQIYEATVEHKIFMYGQMFYQVNVHEANQSVVIYSNQMFLEGELVFVSYKTSDIKRYTIGRSKGNIHFEYEKFN